MSYFETMCCVNQDFTFEYTSKEFELNNLEFNTQQMRTMKLIDHDGLYSNLALLLSDQCDFSIKAAVFQGTDQMVFRDRRDFTGSLIQQMNEVYDFIDFRNQTHSTIEKLLRIDVRDYPEVALKETLLFLLMNRDYSYSAPALINIYINKIEFISIGGLGSGTDLDDVMKGISVCRNKNLADVFYRLNLIEAYGTGLIKIMNAYNGTGKKPIIETTKNVFKIILPNVNYIDEETLDQISIEEKIDIPNTEINHIYTIEEEKITEYTRTHPVIRKNEVVQLLDVSPSTASRIIRILVQNNILKQIGRAKSTQYILANSL